MQQKLMRHAQVSTTMNLYGKALMESKRNANSKVVSLALRLAGAIARDIKGEPPPMAKGLLGIAALFWISKWIS